MKKFLTVYGVLLLMLSSNMPGAQAHDWTCKSETPVCFMHRASGDSVTDLKRVEVQGRTLTVIFADEPDIEYVGHYTTLFVDGKYLVFQFTKRINGKDVRHCRVSPDLLSAVCHANF